MDDDDNRLFALEAARLERQKRTSLKKIAMSAGPFKPHVIFFE